MPNPPDELACGSQSTRRQLSPSRASAAERLIAVVVFPTPPFWFTTAITLPMRNGRVSIEDRESKKTTMCTTRRELWRTYLALIETKAELLHCEGDRPQWARTERLLT